MPEQAAALRGSAKDGSASMPVARRLAIVAVKAFHSAVFLLLQSMICYLVYKGIRGESDRKAAIAAVIVGGECAIYAGNRFRCPLTGVAERLGSEHGAVTDIFLPGWLARNIANIYGPLFFVALLLHYRNLRSRAYNAESGGAMLPEQP